MKQKEEIVNESVNTTEPIAETAEIRTPKKDEIIRKVTKGKKTALVIDKKRVINKNPKSYIEANHNSFIVEYSIMESYETLKKRMRTMDLHLEATLEGSDKCSFLKSSVVRFGPISEIEEEKLSEKNESGE